MRPIAAACSGLLFIAAPAYAEEAVDPAVSAPAAESAAPADGIETVVVTGLRQSIESSIATKRNSDSIVEVVTAEDIGKLPDISIAENLARLPGLTAQRVDGRAQVISIRGMAPKYGVTLLNGREMVSTGDNRAVEYDQFPSELINSAIVYKTPDAALSAIGLSGTVNLKSIRPLDLKERKISFNLRGERNGNGELNDDTDDLGGRFSASYIDQFADNTIGVAIGWAHLDNPGQEKYYKSWWWADTGQWGNQIPGLAAGTTALQGFEVGETSTERKRDGLMAVLEFKPNENLHSMVDLYYTKFDQESIQRELQAEITTWSGVNYTNPTYSAFGGTQIATGGTINNVNPVLLNRKNDREDDVFAIGWNTEYKRDKWKFDADLSYSKAKRDEYNGELTAKASAPISLTALIKPSGSGLSKFTPSSDMSDPATVLLTEQWGRGGRASMPEVEDEMKTFRLSAERAFDDSFVTSVEGGINYSDREKDMNRSEVYYYLNGGAPVAVASGLLDSPTSLGQAGIPGVLSWDFDGVLSQYYTPGVPAALDQQPGRKWNVNEKVTTVFGKANFDIDMKVPVSGNVGVQFVRTKQDSKGMVWNGVGLTSTSSGKTYEDFLPSLNLKFDFSNLIAKGTYLRFGAAREMAHPNMEDMRAGFSASVGGTCDPVTPLPTCTWSGSGGNPDLDPWRAEAYDLSLEKYFGKRSYISVARFYKHLESFVYNQTIRHDFTGVPNASTNVPGSNIGNLTAPANGQGGMIRGSEVSATIDLGLFMPSLDGIGFIGSVSSTKSNLHEANNESRPLDGMSGIVRNLTVYYEKGGFSARISERFREKFQTTVRNQFGDNVFSAINSEKIVDMQLGYEFQEGAYKGLSVLFQVNNLTDEPYETKVGSATNGELLLPERHNTYGRQFLLGATYKF
jgi:iron complex outermembrane receptor protein